MMKKINLIFAALMSFGANALEIPTELKGKTITIISHSNAGGQNDMISRAIAKKVEEQTGLNIVVANKPGASGNIGAKFVQTAEPNGLTLCHCDSQPLIFNAAAKMNNSIQLGDLEPIIILRQGPMALVVPYTSKISSVKDLIDESLTRELNFATLGNQTTFFANHLMLLGKSSHRLNIIPYKGDPENIIAVSQNMADFTFVGLTTAVMFEKAKKVKIIAVGGDKRIPHFPQYPTIKETLNMNVIVFSGIFGPKNMPLNIQVYLNTIFSNAARDEEFLEFLKGRGLIYFGGTADKANEFYTNQFKTTTELFNKLKM